jgi:hypothetical protein
MLLRKDPLAQNCRQLAVFMTMFPEYGLTYFQFPSGVFNCRPAIGCEKTNGRLPKSVCQRNLNVIVKIKKNLDGPKGSVAIVATTFQVSAILQLLFLWKFKNLPSKSKLSINLLRRQSDIGDIKETNFLDSLVQLTR